MTNQTHLVVCKTNAALEYLKKAYSVAGNLSEKGRPMSKRQAMLAWDVLLAEGFECPSDFYLG